MVNITTVVIEWLYLGDNPMADLLSRSKQISSTLFSDLSCTENLRPDLDIRFYSLD